MKLNKFFERPIAEQIKEFEVIGMKPIIGDDGELIKLIVEYVPSKTTGSGSNPYA